jgi:hypothetical protein
VQRSQTFYVPREALRITSGVSEDVAMAVTQPAWPDNEPMKRSDSDMLAMIVSRTGATASEYDHR